MLNDPIFVSANSPTPALSFAIIQSNGIGANRKDVPNGYNLNINHSTTARTGEKHYMQLQQELIATDPITGASVRQTASVSLAVAIPAFGWDAAHKVALVQALLDTLGDSQVTIAGLLSFQS